MYMVSIILVLVIFALIVVFALLNSFIEMREKTAFIINTAEIILVGIGVIFIMKDLNKTTLIQQKTFAATPPTVSVAEVPVSPKNVLTDKEIEELYNYSIVLDKYGEPMSFKDSSLRIRESERFAATGFFDAVTYTTATEEEQKEEGWIESFVYDEIRSNPIYAQGAFLALQDIGIIGNEEDETISNWAKAYSEKMYDTFSFVGELNQDKIDALMDGEMVSLPLSDEYNMYSTFMAELLHGASNEGIHSTKEGWKVVKMFALDVDNEKIIEVEKSDPYEFWVFKFQYKDGTVKYIGINMKDFRFLILTPPTPKTSTPPTSKPDPKPNTPDPDNPDPNNPDPNNPEPVKDPDDRPGPKDDEPDDKGPGNYEPTEPDWPSTPTVIVGDDTSDREPPVENPPVIDPTADAIDQNKPGNDPTPIHDGGVPTSDPINDGTVDPF